MALSVRDLTSAERAKLQRLANSQTAPVRLARRAAIILRADASKSGTGRMRAISPRSV